MRASHKKRLARLLATLPSPDDAERREVERRFDLRFDAMLCAVIRAAMERQGLDPGQAPALREVEASVEGFADTPELRAADEAFRAAHPDDDDDEENEGGDPREELIAELYRLARRFIDGSSPDFARCSLSELWAWTIAQRRLDKARRAVPDNSYVMSVHTP